MAAMQNAVSPGGRCELHSRMVGAMIKINIHFIMNHL